MDYQSLTMSQVFEEGEAIMTDGQKLFGHLNGEQINWKPSADQWSVGQCLEHLIAANHEMFRVLDTILRGEKITRLWERVPAVPKLFGKLMVKLVSPGSNQKLKAPGAARPSTSSIDPGIVKVFLDHQREVIRKIKVLEDFNPAETIMTSPFAKVVIYSVLDACRLIVAHERRHFVQAQMVMTMPEFPK